MTRHTTLQRRLPTRTHLAWLLGLLAVGPEAARAAPGPGGEIVVKENLGVLPGDDYSVAYDINGSNVIVGQSGFSAGAFIWTPPGPMVRLEDNDALRDGSAINESGQIFGNASFLDYAMDTFLYTPPGPAVYVEPPPGTLYDEMAGGMNELGELVGAWEDPPFRPFYWTAPGPAVDLGTLGGAGGWANDINDLSQIVGTAGLPNDVRHAFYWTEQGGMLDLDPANPDVESSAVAINEGSEIVGYYYQGPYRRAAYWSGPGAAKQDLGDLGVFTARARDINDAGVIVGESGAGIAQDLSEIVHAFRKEPGDPMFDLGTLGGEDSAAHAISSKGHVVGSAELPNGETRAVVWWIYRINDAFDCICDTLKTPDTFGGDGDFEILIYGTPALGVDRIDPSTLSLGDRAGDDTPVASAAGRAGLRREDVDGDGLPDLIVPFSGRDLIRNGDWTPRTSRLWLQGALTDRDNAIYGWLELPHAEPRGHH